MKILVCDPVDESVIEHFSEREDFEVEQVFERSSLEANIREANFLVVRSGTEVDRSLLEAAPDLVGIVRAGVGLDRIDLKAAEDRGIQVKNTPEASTNAVAELVVGLILSVMRSIPRADRSIKQNRWIKSDIDGRELGGKTLGVLGYGRIGKRIGELVKPFEVEVLGHDKYIPDRDIRRAGARPVELNELLRASDVLTIHVPLMEETRHLIGSRQLDHMKEEAVLINCARGGVVDESALDERLEEGKLFGAGLDTFEQEPPSETSPAHRESVVATPHIGAATREAQQRIAELVVEKIETMTRNSH